MKNHPISIKPFGQRAILVEWPNEVSESILGEILEFVECFKSMEMHGWEMSIAYNSLTMVNTLEDVDFESINKQILDCHGRPKGTTAKRERFLWKIPVCYDLEFGIDLEEVANTLGLSQEQLIAHHTSHEYTVYGIGFLPGFMYLGGLPGQLEIPRRKEPRLHVAKGSVGLAGKQTGIYPQDSPGGWNIIGSCPTPVFNPNADEPCFVKVGDRIQFKQISKGEYDLHKIEAEVGIYKPEKFKLDA
ncbi:5-oxoprolinase subunit PxpB [Flagellimonas myxillae]|uniref:5-oxoprolinase subunit PxpB n=1 Tax=Flagellimonas myxillae TaxID=2942214 RepID=UPI00201F1A99|nr:5-oxoprolinase subunit PxpB [Muricauda myxillae]MCL6265783.1 5-oxoprolinase subunit PxpB [Muricauda myxillae]